MNIAHRLICLLIFVLWTAIPGQTYAYTDDWTVLPGAAGPAFVVPCPVPADPPVPIVTVKVQVPACANADKNLEYRICVENISPAQALKVVVLDLLPANAKFVRASPMPHRIGPELQWQLGTLRGHACQEITLVLAPTDNADVNNCVRVQFEHGVCVTTRRSGSPPAPPKAPGDLIIPKEPSTNEPPLATGAKLNLTVEGPKTQSFNETARYLLKLSNVGAAPARNVVLVSELDSKLVVVSASHGGIFTKPFDGKVAWHFGNLPAGQSRTVELVARARQAGVFCLRSRAEFDENPEVFTPVEKTCTTFTGGVPAMLIEMVDREDPIPVNGTTSYPIQILNQGTAPVHNIRITATLPAGMQLMDAKGDDYEVKGKTVYFQPLAVLEPGAQKVYEVYTKALTAGDMIFTVQMTADELSKGGPVTEQERTTVYSEDVPPR
jgi:uncharacterized repeat protein (TIGR01451 family)